MFINKLTFLYEATVLMKVYYIYIIKSYCENETGRCL